METKYQDIRERNPSEWDLLLLVNPEYVREPEVTMGRFAGYHTPISTEKIEGIILNTHCNPRASTYAKWRSTKIGGVLIPTPYIMREGCGSSRHLKFERIYIGPLEIRQAFLEDKVVKGLMFPQILEEEKNEDSY